MRREVKVKTKMVVPLIKMYKKFGWEVMIIELKEFTRYIGVQLYNGPIRLWIISTANAREYDNIRVACWGADND